MLFSLGTYFYFSIYFLLSLYKHPSLTYFNNFFSLRSSLHSISGSQFDNEETVHIQGVGSVDIGSLCDVNCITIINYHYESHILYMLYVTKAALSKKQDFEVKDGDEVLKRNKYEKGRRVFTSMIITNLHSSFRLLLLCIPLVHHKHELI